MFATSYAGLPGHLYTFIGPTRVARPRLIVFNRSLAAQLGLALAERSDADLAEYFSGNALLPGSQPLAMAYAGHQFGQFVPQLGDGRAILLGEVRDRSGGRRDVQLKGSGRTPYSRGGDGRAALGPVLREYLVSEAMHALRVPATRSLAAVATGEFVFRDGAVPGAILTRVAASHVRVGTFEFVAARGETEATRQLADYVIARHYPEIASAENPYLELLRSVTRRQAALVAAWMQLGFIHGVMNTDNMAVSGETIDFGPCAFMDAYDPAKVFSSIDTRGRYAYANQPAAAEWNLARFAETLLALIHPDGDRAVQLATEVIMEFSREFAECRLAGMRRKLGLLQALDGDAQLVDGLFDLMRRAGADFTVTFRRLCALAESGMTDSAITDGGDAAASDRLALMPEYRAWTRSWQERLAHEPQPASEHAAFMRRVNPVVIPRNHRIEAVIAAAVERDDYVPFEQLLHATAHPYEDSVQASVFAEPPRPEELVTQTFCGT